MLLDALREATRPYHDALERDGPMRRLVAPDLEPPEYRALLGRLYGFYVPLETALRPHLGAFPAPFDAAHRTRRLAADLAALGEDPSALPLVAEPPALPDADAALGALYVVEGAALGGQVITRHVRRTLGLGPERGLSFFAGEADGTGARWRAFLDLLARRPPSPSVTEAAVAVFASLHAWMLPVPVSPP